MMYKKLVAALVLACHISVQAQEDYHFKIGEEELSGIDIYGINEDAYKTLWITTNNGLYSFDGYEFQRYKSTEQVSNSLFRPTFDYNGVLHCNNLSGQIFKVVNDSLVLAHQVPDSLLGSYTNFDFLPNNDLVISSKVLYRVKGDSIQQITKNYTPQSIPIRLTNGDLITKLTNSSALILSENGYDIYDLPYTLKNKSHFVQRKDQLYEINYLDGIYKLDTINEKLVGKKIMDTSPQTNIYTTSDYFWFAKATTGVQKIGFEDQVSSEVLFSDHFISFVFEDSEQNILLGTFKKGIIVLPKSALKMLKIPDDQQVSKISSGPSNSIFFGTYTGEVYGWNGEEFKLFDYSYNKQIELIEYFPDDEILLIEPFSAYDFKQQKLLAFFPGSTKDYARMGNRMYLVGTYKDLTTYQIENDSIKPIANYNTGRTSKVAYREESSEVIVNTIRGLYVINADGQEKKIQRNGKDFVVNDLVNYDGHILIATQNDGILKISGSATEEFINVDNNDLRSLDVKQIEINNDTIYVSLGNQLQVFDKDLRSIAVFGKSDGINFKILDFSVSPDYIWISSNGNISRINKSIFSEQEQLANDLLKIQGVEVLLNEENVDPSLPLEISEEEISFVIHAPSTSKNADLTYEYKLNDEKWNQNTFAQNIVRYQSLAFGDYEFTIRLKFKEEEIDRKTIVFQVRAPFYYETWFLLAVGLSIMLVFQLIYKKRLRTKTAQSKLQSELNISKLTALQSQMNPHFVFNALNSIQEYIITNEKKLAALYLGKFADLMRIYLDHSRVKEITLGEDLHALNLYLELEKLRFQNTLNYSIEVSESVDTNLMIPSFLAQPYVENAIKHGLFHKQTKRELKICIAIQDDLLQYSIEDNGIGRAASMEINKSRAGHKSFATEATRSRLELLNEGRQISIVEEIVDLKDEEGRAIGTRVTLIIPGS